MRRTAITLSLCLFANQAGILVLSPTLVDVARDFDVSTGAAGQLRAISGIVAGIAAIAVGLWAGRLGLRRLLLWGLGLLAAGSVLSAAAPSFVILAVAQAPIGLAVAILLTAAVAGTTTWVPVERRADALAAAFSGQAAAWLVGQPIVGAVGEISWRYTWIALPFGASLAAFVLARRLPAVAREHMPARAELAALFRNRVLAGWWLGELCAFSGWVGMLVYAGALLIDSYGISVGTTGLLLGAMFVPYFPGSYFFRRIVDRRAQQLLVVLPLGAAGVAAVIGAVRPGLWLTAPLLALFVLWNSGRTLSGSTFALQVSPGRSVLAMGFRSAATQGGYLVGAGLGGLALHFGGYTAACATFAGLYVMSTLPHVAMLLGSRRVSLGS